MKVLVTSGGTKVPIDRVRDITNMSKGTFGSRIAHQALVNGDHVDYLISQDGKSPFSMAVNYGTDNSLGLMLKNSQALYELHMFVGKHLGRYHEHRYRNFENYATSLQAVLEDSKPDITILAAAVSDYGVRNYTDGKIRSGSSKTIELVDYPKLIHQVKNWCPTTFLVGFKLLVGATQDELIAAAMKSIEDNRCDMVVANDYESLKAGAHELILVGKDGPIQTWSGTIRRQGTGLELAADLLKEVKLRYDGTKETGI